LEDEISEEEEDKPEQPKIKKKKKKRSTFIDDAAEEDDVSRYSSSMQPDCSPLAAPFSLTLSLPTCRTTAGR